MTTLLASTLWLSACSTTLDPTVLRPGDDAGGGGAGAPEPVVLATCTTFQGISSEFLLCPEPLAFEAAAHDCQLRRASLAAVHSSEQNQLLTAAAREVTDTNVWLGGTRADDLVWRWPDGTVFWRGGPDGAPEGDAFVLWQPGEPNNASNVTNDPERCLVLTLDGDDWNDRACSLRLPYACERAQPAL